MGTSKGGWWAWSTKKKVLILGTIALVIVALGVGLGAGLGIGLKDSGDDDNGNDNDNDNQTGGTNTTTPTNTTVKWQPAVGTKWQIVLKTDRVSTSVDAPVYDIDLFDNNKTFIADLQAAGRKVICYFSAGTYENWRDDAKQFDQKDLGKDLDEWEGEKWLDVKSDKVRKIMQARLDVAVEKGCDGVDPDNTDGYDNDNGLDLTEDDAIEFVNWLAAQAHSRGLSTGLKNSAAIIPSVIKNMQWCVNEQCAQYDECDTYAPFVDADKPVFQIEYPKGDTRNDKKSVSTKQVDSACVAHKSGNFSTVIKNMELDNWVQYCP
ncbi:hypothetical protein N7475_010350 [Penicillium sp. IBT 31633x]|nr:hypothetical protein N7475_010350 [Penicillium sp. IBT 31633x]